MTNVKNQTISEKNTCKEPMVMLAKDYFLKNLITKHKISNNQQYQSTNFLMPKNRKVMKFSEVMSNLEKRYSSNDTNDEYQYKTNNQVNVQQTRNEGNINDKKKLEIDCTLQSSYDYYKKLFRSFHSKELFEDLLKTNHSEDYKRYHKMLFEKTTSNCHVINPKSELPKKPLERIYRHITSSNRSLQVNRSLSKDKYRYVEPKITRYQNQKSVEKPIRKYIQTITPALIDSSALPLDRNTKMDTKNDEFLDTSYRISGVPSQRKPIHVSTVIKKEENNCSYTCPNYEKKNQVFSFSKCKKIISNGANRFVSLGKPQKIISSGVQMQTSAQSNNFQSSSKPVGTTHTGKVIKTINYDNEYKDFVNGIRVTKRKNGH